MNEEFGVDTAANMAISVGFGVGVIVVVGKTGVIEGSGSNIVVLVAETTARLVELGLEGEVENQSCPEINAATIPPITARNATSKVSF